MPDITYGSSYPMIADPIPGRVASHDAQIARSAEEAISRFVRKGTLVEVSPLRESLLFCQVR